MLGGFNPLHKDATIIGGGIAGLLAAYRLGSCGYEVELHEKGPWLGGMLGTTAYPYGIVERAAHSIRASHAVLTLCNELDVELLPLKNGRTGYIFRNGEFHRFPLGFMETLDMLGRMLLKPMRTEQKTLAQYGHEHMGQAAVDYLLTPMAFGIYGARPSELQLPNAFPRFQGDAGRNLLSHQIQRLMRRRGKAPMVAPRNGMSEIVQKLELALRSMPNVALHVGSPVETLTPANNLILAVPAYEAARLISSEDAATAQLLEQVTYVPLVTATVFIDHQALGRFPGGIGVLIPEKENIPILGILFNSHSFEGRVSDGGLESFTVIFGGTPHPELVEKDDAALEAHIAECLDRIFRLKSTPLKTHIQRWPRAIPLYNTHLALAQQRVREGWGALLGNMVVGNYTGQVSLRGLIEDSLKLSDYGKES